MSEPIHTLTTTHGGLLLLRTLLSAPGWAKKLKKTHRAAKLAKRLPRLPATEAQPADAELDACAVFACDEYERDLCKEAVRHFAEQGAIQATEHSATLIETLGLSEE